MTLSSFTGPAAWSRARAERSAIAYLRIQSVVFTAIKHEQFSGRADRGEPGSPAAAAAPGGRAVAPSVTTCTRRRGSWHQKMTLPQLAGQGLAINLLKFDNINREIMEVPCAARGPPACVAQSVLLLAFYAVCRTYFLCRWTVYRSCLLSQDTVVPCTIRLFSPRALCTALMFLPGGHSYGSTCPVRVVYLLAFLTTCSRGILRLTRALPAGLAALLQDRFAVLPLRRPLLPQAQPFFQSLLPFSSSPDPGLRFTPFSCSSPSLFGLASSLLSPPPLPLLLVVEALAETVRAIYACSKLGSVPAELDAFPAAAVAHIDANLTKASSARQRALGPSTVSVNAGGAALRNLCLVCIYSGCQQPGRAGGASYQPIKRGIPPGGERSSQGRRAGAAERSKRPQVSPN
ncbi:hypothetical protein C7M84_021039 [Penaeus vannamei]|uniref:Uncharacterized protein n=1 Tax=Penaeus vannamei TaxID=6689 RepID=A0A3R7LPU8_PENVA|nr:hypothetical protein C7M84_021039 [Penaeus vannamei]